MADQDSPLAPQTAAKPTRPRWKGGRPRATPEARRGNLLPAVRVTAEELAQVRTQAETLGISIGELIRRAVLGRRAKGVPAVNREAWGRLGPLAANLNQYVKAIHQGQAAGAPLEVLEQLRTELAALREGLLGRDPES